MKKQNNQRSRQVLAITLMLALLLTIVPAGQPVYAADQPDSWAKEEVDNAIMNELVPVSMQNNYTKDITRGEFCQLAITFLEVLMPLFEVAEMPKVADVSFSDTTDRYIIQAANAGIVSGTGNDRFEPNRNITRQEAAVMLYNTLMILPAREAGQAPTFTDEAAIASWAKAAVQQVAARCIMTGTGGGKFSPTDSYTRQQAYMTFMRMGSSMYLNIGISTIDLYVGNWIELGVNLNGGEVPITFTGGGDLVTIVEENGSVVITGVKAGTGTIMVKQGELQLPLTLTVTDPYAPATPAAPSTNTTASTAGSTDFKGKERIRYAHDVAYDLCRQIENEIGIQIFYLPEWTDKEAGLVRHDIFDQLPELQQDYFEYVAQELQILKQAYDAYPSGFLKEMVAKKNNRGLEIILLPIELNGMSQYGLHVYDESNDAVKVDQVYYTGMGDAHFYSHEMGHQVMSSAMILNGWSDSVSKWESYSGSVLSHVSTYASMSRPEDWAETWAFLWHEPDYVKQMMEMDSSGGLKNKVAFTTEVLTKHYSTMVKENLPWAHIL